jgi:NAD-dependent dihydropyrimidine dehydrogenase PreA subunit
MTYVIAEPCINTKDTACVDACPVDCIHPKKDDPKYATEQLLYIDPVECIDCGACVPVCPVSAIFALDDLPEKWNSFTELNAKYFGREPATSTTACGFGARILRMRAFCFRQRMRSSLFTRRD